MSNYLHRYPDPLYEHTSDYNTKIKYSELSENDKLTLDNLREKNKINYRYTGGDNQTLYITTNSFIGSMTLGNPARRINILPKIFKNSQNEIKDINIFLDFAHNGFNYFENAKHFYDKTSESTLLDPIHYSLINEYEKLEKQGLLKSYVIHAENTSSMRGKLLMQHQMLNDAMMRPQFYCEFDELEYDSIENRVILQALTVLERTSNDQKIRMKAMDLAQRLSGSVQKIMVPRPERQRMMKSYNRQNLRYVHIHDLCDRVIDESGIQDIYSGDNSYIIPVFYDMNTLFENFIQNIFTKCYEDDQEYEVKTQHEEPSWRGENLGDKKMKPDIMIEKNDVLKFIVDVKYKKQDITPPDLYQLGFYMHEFSAKHPDNPAIDSAIAITPEYEGVKSGTYVSETGKKVFVKRINIQKCLGYLKENKISELKKEVKYWLTPILSS